MIFTATQLIKRIENVCRKYHLDPNTAEVHFGADTCGAVEVKAVYAGGDSVAESVYIHLNREQ